MNKKGLVLWMGVLMGILIALGSIYLLSGPLESDYVKGEWQLDFLKNSFLKSEKELLKKDILIKQAGLEAAKELAENGGYKPGMESSCGKEGDAQIWLKDGKWCFPGVDLEFLKEKIDQRVPGNSYSEIKFSGSMLTGNGGKETIERELATYTFDTSFSVYLGYSFEEYEQIQEEGLRLIASCLGKEDLEACLGNTKLDNWKYGSCENEEFSGEIVPFCVSSPGLYYLGNELVRYEMAFDFSEN